MARVSRDDAQTRNREPDAEVETPEDDALGVCMQLGRDQIRHNIEVWRNMSGVRDMRELMTLQSEYLRLSFARASQLIAKQAELTARFVGMVGWPVDRRG
jgi:hypothetical protein